MRRMAAVLLTVGWLTCCGCRAAAPPVATGFSCRIEARSPQAAFCADLQRGARGSLWLCCTEPASLAGLIVTANGGYVTLCEDGKTVTLPQTTFSEETPFLWVLRVLDAVAACDKPTGGTVEGFCGKEAYVLRYDTATGAVTSLTVPEKGLTVTFSASAPASG